MWYSYVNRFADLVRSKDRLNISKLLIYGLPVVKELTCVSFR